MKRPNTAFRLGQTVWATDDHSIIETTVVGIEFGVSPYDGTGYPSGFGPYISQFSPKYLLASGHHAWLSPDSTGDAWALFVSWDDAWRSMVRRQKARESRVRR